MALTPAQIDDFVNLTLNNFKRSEWTDISLEHQEYVSASMIDKKTVVERGGPMIEFKVKTRNTGNSRNTGMYARDITKVEDVTKKGVVGWTKQTTNFSYDIDEDLFQGDRETIISELKIREHDALADMAELDEENLWSAPSAEDDIRPMGIPFWLQKDASTTPGGAFNGGNPSTHASGCAGLSSVAFPRWRNWTFGWETVTPEDLISKVKKSLAFTNFIPPVPHPELGFGKAEHQIFTTYRVVEPCERLAESRNDNLGKDLAKFLNQVTIGGVPMKWVPYLEANDTSDPLYGVNWRYLRPYVKKGANMRRSPVLVSPKQHTVREVHYDNWMNWICYNRRTQWVGSKA